MFPCTVKDAQEVTGENLLSRQASPWYLSDAHESILPLARQPLRTFFARDFLGDLKRSEEISRDVMEISRDLKEI